MTDQICFGDFKIVLSTLLYEHSVRINAAGFQSFLSHKFQPFATPAPNVQKRQPVAPGSGPLNPREINAQALFDLGTTAAKLVLQ